MSIQVEWIDWTEQTRRAEIRRHWDNLYERSTVRQPTSRFEHVELWFDCFAPRAKREALVVEENGRWLAVAPLIRTRLYGFLPTWEIPNGYWTPSPEILIDTEQHRDPGLIGSLLHGMMRNGRWLVRANELLGDSSVVKELKTALGKSPYEHDWSTRYEVGKVPIHGAGAPVDWADFQRQLSGNFRRQMRKMLNRAEREGGVELQVTRPTSGQEAEPWVRAGFELEHRGWKGTNQSSILSHPGLANFFFRQAGLLAARNKLIILNLIHQGETIAFEYGFRFKRTYFSPKIAYNENYARLSPGHLLMLLWIERMYSEDEFDCFDFAGPITEATAKWSFRTYPVQRLVAGTGWKGKQVIKASRIAKQAKSSIENWRQRLGPANHENPVGVPAEANL